ncbi:Imm72 family immunity protein [Duganella hordei]|uniref:Imm72 family immunity protein n=1 Tax=Duganella hordei TaxID=2865934 RepID=UPI0030EA6CE7
MVGTVSEQFGEKIPGQYLPGGATQAFFFLEKDFKELLNKVGHDFANGAKTSKLLDSATGLEFTFHSTGDSFSLDTTWRLLWRDDRYINGTVPEEEAHYRFTKPDQVQPPAPAIWAPKETVWAESGNTVPFTGKWLVESDLYASVMLQKGEKLPLYQGREVRWVLAES